MHREEVIGSNPTQNETIPWCEVKNQPSRSAVVLYYLLPIFFSPKPQEVLKWSLYPLSLPVF